MEENEHPVWAELRDMQAHERREFEARARGESSSTSFLRLNSGKVGAGPAPRSPAPPTQSGTPFRFPWSGGGGGGGGGRGWREHPANPARQGRGGAGGGRGGGTQAGLAGLFPSERYDDDRVGEWPPGGVSAAAAAGTGAARDSSRGGAGAGGAGGMPGLLRGLGAAAPGRGFLLRGRRGGAGGGNDGLRGGVHDRGSEEDMGPAEFGLLMGEGPGGVQEPLLADDWGAVENLDTFFTNMYKYYHSRGLLSIVSTGVAHLLILAFTVLFSTFLLSFVDWTALLSCRDEDTCHPLSQYVTTRAFRKPNLFHVLVWMYMVLFLVYWMWSLLSFGTSLRDATDMHQLYTSRLKISPTDIHTIEWSEVVTRFLALQNSGIYRVAIYANDVTAHDIASRIMRKENYLIAMLNKGILKLSLPLPFLGSRGSGTLWATTGRQYLTKSLEWSVHFCVLNHMFSDKFTIRRAFLEDVRALRVRLVLVGLAHVVLLPFLLLFMVVYFFLQNAQEWHSSKSYLGPREWSPLARWTFREFNELQHFFERRMSGSYVHANGYLMRFPRPVLASLMRVIRFVSGAVVAVLLVMTFLEDSILLHVKVWDRNLLWYIGVFSAIYAFSRSVSPQASEASALQGESVEEVMLKVASHTHYMPEHWVGKAHTVGVRKELLTMFHYKAQLFVEELLSVLFAPIILCFSMPSCAQEIVDFVTDHTVDVEGVGSVCSYSLFDFGRYGDGDYAAPLPSTAVAEAGREDPARRRPDTTEQGKMEKSFLNFRTHYPDWQPGAAGQEMIDRLAGFQLQCLRKDAEIVAASTAAAVAVAASAASATLAGPGGSHWGQSTGVPPGSHAYGQNPVAPQPGMGGESRGDAPAQGSRGEKLNHPEDSAHGAEGNGSVQSGMGDNGGRKCGEDGGGGGEKDGVFAAEADDERSDRASPMFPLLSPPRAEPGHAAGPAGGGRLSPSVGMTPSTVQLGLLNSVSPSMLLGPGAGAWLGATGGVGGGTGGFGMSAAAPSFVQTSQLAPFLLSQMGPHGSFGVGTPSIIGRAAQGAPAASGAVGQGQEKNFYWLERFYAAHRSSAGLSSASGDASHQAATASAGLSHGGGFGSKFGVRHDRGGGGGAGGRGTPSHGHGHSSMSSAVMHRGDGAAGGRVTGGGTGVRGGGIEGGREGAGRIESDGEGYAMEMTSQQQQQHQQQQLDGLL